MYEQNKWYVRIKDFYKKGFYTVDQVKKFVPHLSLKKNVIKS